MQEEKQVATIRRFNRYYTNVLGLLDQHILESDSSLSEVRIMHEIYKMTNCTSKILSDILYMDAGYITYMHGWMYKEEYNYTTAFEAYVAESFYEFLLNYNPEKDRLWCAEHNGKIIIKYGVRLCKAKRL